MSENSVATVKQGVNLKNPCELIHLELLAREDTDVNYSVTPDGTPDEVLSSATERSEITGYWCNNCKESWHICEYHSTLPSTAPAYQSANELMWGAVKKHLGKEK